MLVGENAESRAKIKELTGESCIFPLDCALGISKVPFKMTPRMILTVAREGVRGKSYKEAAITLNDRFNVEFKPDLVRRVTDHVGRIVWNDDLEQAKQAKEWLNNPKFDNNSRSLDACDIFVIGTDGAYIDTREESWKETKIGLCYNIKDMYTWHYKNGEIGRRITKKDLVAYIGNAEEFKYHLLALGLRNNVFMHNQIISITDGAVWIKNMIAELFPDAIHILDLCHVKERISKFGKLNIRGKHKKEEWVRSVNDLIENGKTDDVLKKLEPFSDKKNQDDDTNLYGYISKRRNQMKYDEYRDKGYPVGSGAQESANKYGMQDRMTLQGQRWKKERGQGVLALKCRYESERWSTVEELLFKHYGTPVAKFPVTSTR